MRVIRAVVEGCVSRSCSVTERCDRVDSDYVVSVDLEFVYVAYVCALEDVRYADLYFFAGLNSCFLNTVCVLCTYDVRACVLLYGCPCRLIVVCIDHVVVLLYRSVSRCLDLLLHCQVLLVLSIISVILSLVFSVLCYCLVVSLAGLVPVLGCLSGLG